MPSKTKTKTASHKLKKIQTKKIVVSRPSLKASEEFGSKYLSMLLDGKKSAKKEVYCGFSDAKGCDVNSPLLLIFATDLNGEKELIEREVLFKFLEGLRVLNLRVVIVDTQQQSDIQNLSELGSYIKNHIIWYNPKTDNSGRGREEKEIDRLLLAADLALVFNHHLELVHLLMNYGIVIIGDDKSPLLENYKPNEESGNAFLFSKKGHWDIFAALVRALETYKFPYDWKHIIRKIYK
jgi:hypothetical protein